MSASVIDSTQKSSPPAAPERPSSEPPSARPALRRSDGARVNLSRRLTLVADGGRVLDGWALNVSRGGIRVIVEDATVHVGDEFEIRVGDEGEPDAWKKRGYVVWAKAEPDGTVVGLEFHAATSGATWKAVTGEEPED